MSNRYAAMVGDRWGSLRLETVLQTRIAHRIAGRFRCDCGAEIVCPIGRVTSFRKTHCGCQTDHSSHATHGMKGSPEYRSWGAMKTRCLNPHAKDYPRYGGAGVTIHPAWIDSFEAFYADIGPRPEGATLDRIDGTRGYVPGNVRWATPQQQAENTTKSWTVEIGNTLYASVEEAAKKHGVSTMTIVRWCDGFRDPRRGNAFTPPRPNCRRWRTNS